MHSQNVIFTRFNDLLHAKYGKKDPIDFDQNEKWNQENEREVKDFLRISIQIDVITHEKNG